MRSGRILRRSARYSAWSDRRLVKDLSCRERLLPRRRPAAHRSPRRQDPHRDARRVGRTFPGAHRGQGVHPYSQSAAGPPSRRTQAVLDEQNAFVVVAETVRQARERLSDWTAVPNRWSAVGPGSGRKLTAGLRWLSRRRWPTRRLGNFTSGGNKLNTCATNWRSWQPLWPERLEELVNEADRMGDLLGDDHDLAVFHQMLTDDPERFGDRGEPGRCCWHSSTGAAPNWRKKLFFWGGDSFRSGPTNLPGD